MSQEQVPEGAPPVDALLEGYEGRGACKACEVASHTYATTDEATRAYEALKSIPHTCGKSSLTVAEHLEAWALTGQPGALLGVPECPPGTTLAK